jgi:ketosteroid isomerase-like protein
MDRQVALEFVDAINHADIERMRKLLSPDHLFIDSQDNRVQGRDKMMNGWVQYFVMFPDYLIDIETIVEDDRFICFFGYASATYKKLKDETNSNYWRIPAAWTAIVENGHIKQWRVYADNSVVIEIVNRCNKFLKA